jgi:thiopurine S-methyltransferase
MDPAYWRARWRDGQIGFHQGRPNEHLVAHAEVLAGARRVLVPLSGKSVDLAWLARTGAPRAERSVVGVELVEEAVRAFFDEQGISAQRTVDGPFVRYEAGPIEIFAGDFFELGRGELGTFDGCFDRAALVALPPSMRARYVAHVRTLLEPGARILLVSLLHDADPNEPPFAVDEAEIRTLYAGAEIRLLDDVPWDSAALRARGATSVRETVWSIELPPAQRDL